MWARDWTTANLPNRSVNHRLDVERAEHSAAPARHLDRVAVDDAVRAVDAGAGRQVLEEQRKVDGAGGVARRGRAVDALAQHGGERERRGERGVGEGGAAAVRDQGGAGVREERRPGVARRVGPLVLHDQAGDDAGDRAQLGLEASAGAGHRAGRLDSGGCLQGQQRLVGRHAKRAAHGGRHWCDRGRGGRGDGARQKREKGERGGGPGVHVERRGGRAGCAKNEGARG